MSTVVKSPQLFVNPTVFNLGVNLVAKKRWTEMIMSDKSREILAVQTIRNAIMTTTFFATSSSVIGFFAINLAISAQSSAPFQAFQYALLGCCFLVCFINMAYATRGYFHASFLVVIKSIDPHLEDLFEGSIRYAVPATAKFKRQYSFRESSGKSDVEAETQGNEMEPRGSIQVDKEKLEKFDRWVADYINPVVKLLNRSTIHFTIGLRFFYLALPLGLWILNSIGLLVGSVLIVLIMYYSDHSM